ncbi:ATP-dependent helicase HrpB [Myxococcota bacterium]|nr:ATP-dependent helicase HrpB [Myxococcota bacterium]
MAGPPPDLPVDGALPALREALRRAGAAVLVADPGSGKSTRAAPALLDLVPAGQRVLLLQPRRAAARLLADRIAQERAGPPGEVGYRVRFESTVTPTTRLEVLTEGLLVRRLLDDPFLDGGEGGRWGPPVGAVVLDELHERSLHTDLALALLREVRQARPELLLLCMSATLDPGPVAAFLGDAPVLRAEGRAFPVRIEHEARDLQPGDAELVARVEGAVRRLLAEPAPPGAREEGDLLCFLPGAGEIERVAAALADLPDRGVAVLPLHGALPPREQDRALAAAPPPGFRRRVVLATNLAETSVTIPGVTLVVDSGLCREPRLDPATGLERLETTLISQASADQRAGRAGRTAPGRCLRLWSAVQHARRAPADTPELLRLDLAGTALAVASWGSAPTWLSPPPPASWSRAQALLGELGATTPDGGLTPLGRRLAALPVHPRLGRVLLATQGGRHAPAAAALAALVSERDPWPRGARVPVEDRLLSLRGGPASGASTGPLAAARAATRQLARLVGAPASGPVDLDALVPALLAGFPERLGRRRVAGEARVLLASGRGAELAPGALPGGAQWLVALELRGRPRGEDQVELAVPLTEEAVLALPRQRARVTAWDPSREAVVAAEEERIGALVLVRREVMADPVEAAAALARAAGQDPARLLDPSPAARALILRALYLRARRPELDLPDWPDLDAALRALLPDLCRGLRRLQDLRGADLLGATHAALGWQARQQLDLLAPATFTLPTGRQVELDYDPHERQGGGPVLRARVQQLFGLDRTPTVLGGTEPVTLHLLAPNQRPVQVTTDLPGFWRRTWPEVRKDLRGRYPKHAWPEDPLRTSPEDRPSRKTVAPDR